MLGAMLLLEPVDGDDIPLTILGEITDPREIFRVPREAVGQVDDVFNLRSNLRSLLDAVGKMG